MGETKLTFKRYEKKYLLSAQQYEQLRQRLDNYILPDVYFRSTVYSLYYDGDDFSLVRHSLDAPVYKEKLRVRSYGHVGLNDTVYVELKKKYKGIVYKRRVPMTAKQADSYLSCRSRAPVESQMTREIDWFLQVYKPSPRVMIVCEREAYAAKDNPELRITFDKSIRWRQSELDITAFTGGEELLDSGEVLMEIKLPSAAPLYLASMLSELKIFPTNYSKYGNCYKKMILNGVINHA